MNKFDWQAIDVRYFAVAASLLLSLLTAIFHAIPNDDAYTYVRTAEIFVEEGIPAAFAHYQWATYSILIGSIHRLLGIDLFSAAYLINALFFALLVYSFISVIKEINDSKRVVLLAAITVLVYPQLNEFRHAVIRDIGFWSLSLFALWQFIIFGRTHRVRHALAFCAALLLASTLRVESVLYLLVIPLTLLFDNRLSRSQRIKFGALYTGASVALLLIIVLVFSLAGLNLVQLFVDFTSVYIPFISSTFFPTDAESLQMARAIFNDHAANFSRDYLVLFMLFGLFSILLVNIFNAIGGPFLIVLVIGFFRKYLTIPRNVLLPLLAILILNGLILFVFVFITRYLTNRYAMLFCLVLSMFVPIILDQILQWAESINKKLVVSQVIGVFLLYCAIDAFISFGRNKDYLYDAATWVAENSSESTRLITNNHVVAYYSGKVVDYDLTARNLTEADILQAGAGSLILVEINYDMTQLFDSDTVSSKVEQLNIYPDENEQRLILYRRKAD